MATETASNLTTFEAFLKTRYGSEEWIKRARLKAGPLLTHLIEEGDTSFGGKNINWPIEIGGAFGISTVFATAQANADPLNAVAFTLTRQPLYGVTAIGDDVISASSDEAEAYFKAMAREIDALNFSFLQMLAIYMYGDGTGNLGQVSSTSTVASATITLTDINTVKNFQLGQTVMASPNADGTSPRTGSATISGIQYIGNDQGQLTTAGGNWSTQITSLVATDYLFNDGDAANAPPGVQAWVPQSAPSSMLFYGIDRTQNSYLYGSAFDASPYNIVEGLQLAVGQLLAVGSNPDAIYLSPRQFLQLSIAMQANGRFGNQPSGGVNGFKSIAIMTPAGEIPVTMDVWCPDSRGFIFQMDTLMLLSNGEVPGVMQEDGLYIVRSPTTASYEHRIRSYTVLAFTVPGYNLNVNLPALPSSI